MLFETVTTNGASILTMIVLWAMVSWMLTYMYLKEKHRKVVEFLDWYCYYSDEEVKNLRSQIAHDEDYIALLHDLLDGTEDIYDEEESIDYLLTDKGFQAMEGES
jgi:hypothetical protein